MDDHVQGEELDEGDHDTDYRLKDDISFSLFLFHSLLRLLNRRITDTPAVKMTVTSPKVSYPR